MKAVCYARVSTVEQAQSGISLDAQIDRLNSYCDATGLEPILAIREEGISGAKPLAARPGGAKLLKVLDSGAANHVVAMKLDRLFRSTEDALQQTTEWDKNGVVLHLCDIGGQNLNTSSAMGRMMLTLMASFAEFERNLISERTCAALAYKKRKKQAYNHLPYGFDRDDKNLVPNETEQKVLAHIFQWREDGLSLYAVASRLNDLGVPSKRGGKWHSATISHILNNDLYRQTDADNLIEWQTPTTSKSFEVLSSLPAHLLGDEQPNT